MINAIKFSIEEIEASDQYFDHTGADRQGSRITSPMILGNMRANGVLAACSVAVGAASLSGSQSARLMGTYSTPLRMPASPARVSQRSLDLSARLAVAR